LVANFDLIDQLGRGGCGTVFRVFDRELRREVALKVPHEVGDSRNNAQFLKEAQAAAALEHPNIVPVFEIGNFDGRFYIVSQLVKGLSLSEFLSGKELTSKEAATLCENVARGLQHAHGRGVVHRDIKPSNILLDEDSCPRITDFGLAKRSDVEYTATLDGQVMGTFAYMPPEQARGESSVVDGRADVYSLGVVLYQLLTGKRPFEGTGRAILKQVLEDAPLAPRSIRPDVPRDLETICLKAMEKVPVRRYQTAGELADDLKRYVEGRPILARPCGVVGKSLRWIRRNRMFAGMAATIACLCCVMVFAFTRPNKSDKADGDPKQSRSKIESVIAQDRKWTCQITTDPPGAELTFIRLRSEWQQPEPNEEPVVATSPASVSLLPGEYEVHAVHPSGKRHTVLRTVPDIGQTMPHGRFPHVGFTLLRSEEGVLEFSPIALFDRAKVVARHGLVLVEGGTFQMGIGDEKHKHRVDDFFIGKDLVTVQQFRDAMRDAFFAQDVLRYMPDLSERLGDKPLTSVTYESAMYFAEVVGTRLITEVQYEFAATNRGHTVFPQGESADVSKAWASVDGVVTDVSKLGIRRLFSGPGEWTRSTPIAYAEKFYADFYSEPGKLQKALRESLACRRVVRGISAKRIEEGVSDDTNNDSGQNPRTLRPGIKVGLVPWKNDMVGFRLAVDGD
jgi:serine/threonine protein kinase